MRRAARDCGRGFTLLELLVALAVAGVMVGLAVGRLDSSERAGAAREIARLQGVLGLASEQAVLQGAELGVGFDAGGYRLFRRAHGDWTPAEELRLYRPHRLGPGMRVALRVEGEPVALGRAPPHRPQVLLWSSGELTPFELRLEAADGTRTLRGAADGTLAAGSG